MAYTNGRYRKQSEAEILGLKFGKLKPIREIAQQWSHKRVFECLCDCGNTKAVQLGNLRGGRTRSCGCLKKKGKHQLNIGDKFGRLTIEAPAPPAGKKGAWYKAWYVSCECGAYFTVPPSKDDPEGVAYCKHVRQASLISGATKSCGCIRTEHIMKLNEEYERLSAEQTGTYVVYPGSEDTTPENK